MQKEAELEIARENLKEAERATWAGVHTETLMQKLPNHEGIKVLAPCDWVDGDFHYDCEFYKNSPKFYIGGFEHNDRFAGSNLVYAKKDDVEKLLK